MPAEAPATTTTSPVAPAATACDIHPAERRILIIGGGYAGTTLAVRLGRELKRHPRPGAEVLLLETSPCQQALAELDLVAAGSERPEFCELWLPAVLKDLPVSACFNRAESIDCDARTVTVRGTGDVGYWRLVVASGAVPAVPAVPGLAEHALTMWSVADAHRLQEHLTEQMKLAASMPRAEDRRRALAITVCGGGATGVEVVGSLGQLLPKRAAEAGLDTRDLNIHLVEGRPDILYDLPERQRGKAQERLAEMNVEVVVGSMVSSVDPNRVTLADGREVPATILVWCGGAHADPHAKTWGFELDARGRICVDDRGRVPGHEDVYALGDVAAFRHPGTGRTLPMLAQFAIASAEHAADNLLAEFDGAETTPFAPDQHGEFVSVGPSWGVGWMFGLTLSGLPAIVMKRVTYVRYWFQVGGLRLAWRRGRELLSMQR
jgi:NADH dehydrogenase